MTATTVPTAPLPSLLPCPFCGSTDIELHGDILFDGRWAVCGGCCCTMSEMDVKGDADAIARWNKRSDAALLTMQRERDNANEWAAKHIEAAAHFENQLAASERTCAELRAGNDFLIGENFAHIEGTSPAQPRFGWIEYGKTFGEFVREDLCTAGTAIYVDDEKFLIGDLNDAGGVCGHCHGVESDKIVSHYWPDARASELK